MSQADSQLYLRKGDGKRIQHSGAFEEAPKSEAIH